MAIKLTFTSTKTGAIYTNTYQRINSIMIDKAKKLAQISVVVFYTESQKDAGKLPIFVEGQKMWVFAAQEKDYDEFFGGDALNKADQNPFSQAYLFLRTLGVGEGGNVGSIFDYKKDGVDV